MPGKLLKKSGLRFCLIILIFIIFELIYMLLTKLIPYDNEDGLIFKKLNNVASLKVDNTKNCDLREQTREGLLKSLERVPIRDYIRYECKNLKRIGGFPPFVEAANNTLLRIDGAWFVCFDKYIAPVENDCLVVSFGINEDESFDLDINQNYKCQVYSFDPFIEAQRFKDIRATYTIDKDRAEIQVNNKWLFSKIGITDVKQNDKKFMTFDEILDKLNIRNKVIDIFKMDIEGPEYKILETIDIDYMCKYVKQFMLETHAPSPRPPEQPHLKYFKILGRIEKCFSLFYRHTRFFIQQQGTPTGWASEWQLPVPFKLDITRFKNETELALYMFVNGELYFLNENFLK